MVEKTFYRYREKYAGMDATEARRLRELEEENLRLKKMFSEQMHHNEVLRDVLSRKWWARGAPTGGLPYAGGLRPKRAERLPRAPHGAGLAAIRSEKSVPVELVARMRSIAATRPRAGYRTLGRLLLREGVRVNPKRTTASTAKRGSPSG